MSTIFCNVLSFAAISSWFLPASAPIPATENHYSQASVQKFVHRFGWQENYLEFSSFAGKIYRQRMLLVSYTKDVGCSGNIINFFFRKGSVRFISLSNWVTDLRFKVSSPSLIPATVVVS